MELLEEDVSSIIVVVINSEIAISIITKAMLKFLNLNIIANKRSLRKIKNLPLVIRELIVQIHVQITDSVNDIFILENR